jgi:hypothetical protein
MTNQGRLDAIKAHRAIGAALRAIRAHAPVLRAAYGDERLPVEVYSEQLYGPCAGVALLTETAKQEYAAEIARRQAVVPTHDPTFAREERERAIVHACRQIDERIDATQKAIKTASVAPYQGPLEAGDRRHGVCYCGRASVKLCSRKCKLEMQLSRLMMRRDSCADSVRVTAAIPSATLAKTQGAQKLKGATMGEWLRSARSKEHRPAIRGEMETLLREARACFQLAHQAAKEELKARRRGPKVQEPEPVKRKRVSRPPVHIEPITATMPGGYL